MSAPTAATTQNADGDPTSSPVATANAINPAQDVQVSDQPPAKRQKTSKAHSFFLELPDGTRKCRSCDKVMSAKSSTDSMNYHVQSKHPMVHRQSVAKAKPQPQMPAYFKGGQVDKLSAAKTAAVHAQLARFFIATSTAFSIVDNPEFRSLLSLLNPGYVVMGRQSLKRKILSRYGSSKQKVVGLLAQALGRISITTDCWTSGAQESFMPVTAHWIAPGFRMVKVLLDFVYIPERHTAKNLAARLLKV